MDDDMYTGCGHYCLCRNLVIVRAMAGIFYFKREKEEVTAAWTMAVGDCVRTVGKILESAGTKGHAVRFSA